MLERAGPPSFEKPHFIGAFGHRKNDLTLPFRQSITIAEKHVSIARTLPPGPRRVGPLHTREIGIS
jgi:hypothetical protein